MRQVVRTQFENSRNEVDEHKIELLKSNAIRGLSNYMLYNSALSDKKLGDNMKKFHRKNMQELNPGMVDEDDENVNHGDGTNDSHGVKNT